MKISGLSYRHPFSTSTALRMLALMLLACLPLFAATPSGQAITATVGGRPVRLADVELHLLRREGAEAVGEIAKTVIAGMDWGTLPDGPILTLPGGAIDRAGLVAVLMPRHRDLVLEELISIAVVRAACAERGIVINEELLRTEIARAERKLEQSLAARGMPPMDLDSFLKESQQTTLAEYTARPMFRHLVVGLHALVRAEAVAAVGEDELHARFAAAGDRFVEPEAVDCSIIYIPFRRSRDEHGAEVVTEAERERLAGVMRTLHQQLADDKIAFATAFGAYARSYDVDVSAAGRVGWVQRDGSRGRPKARVIPAAVREAAFACEGPFPRLMAPIAHDDGIEIVLVHGWRPESRPHFDAVRERLAAELVEADLEVRARTVLARLRAASPLTQRDDGTIMVGGTAIRVREIEDAVLRKAGAQAAQDQLFTLLEAVDWAALPVGVPVLGGRGWSVERPVLIARLLEQNAAAVREDLIGIELLRGAVEGAGITVDGGMVEREISRLERAYRRSSEAASRDFARFVRTSYGSSLAALRLDPAFRALAGCAEVLRRTTVITDDEARAFYAANAAVYHQDEAVDCSLIHLPHRPLDGRRIVEADRERTRKAAGQLHALLSQPGADFVNVWREFGQRNDPYAINGRLGWIPRDGRRSNPAARTVPEPVLAAAFAHEGVYPALLPPIEHADGVDLVVIHAHRPASLPNFDAVADTVRRDCLEVDWDRRLQTFVDDLRRRTEIIYHDLPPLVQARIAELNEPAENP